MISNWLTPELTGVALMWSGGEDALNRIEGRPRLESLGRVRLPDSVTGRMIDVNQGLDAAVFARFEMAAQDLDGFLRQAGYTGLSFMERADRNWHLADVDWWRPEDAKTFPSGRLRRESGTDRHAGHVLVRDRGATRTVYLFVMSL